MSVLYEKEPQIKAPRVTPLEGVSTYALRGIRVRGVENTQGFGIDERRFVVPFIQLNYLHCKHISRISCDYLNGLDRTRNTRIGRISTDTKSVCIRVIREIHVLYHDFSLN